MSLFYVVQTKNFFKKHQNSYNFQIIPTACPEQLPRINYNITYNYFVRYFEIMFIKASKKQKNLISNNGVYTFNRDLLVHTCSNCTIHGHDK